MNQLTIRQVENFETDDGDPHKMMAVVLINEERHYAHAWRVVDEEQNPHPEMSGEHKDWYHDLTVETTPDGQRRTVELPGFEGRWVVVVCP